MHAHSAYSSDGVVAPQIILEEARKLGLGAIAIADHDTVAAVPSAIDLAEEIGVNYIPAVEMTTNLVDMFLHLLGYYLDPHDAVLTRRLADLAESRWQQAWARVDKLRQLNFQVDDEELIRMAKGKAPVGPIIAMAVFSHPANTGDPRLDPYLTGDRQERPYYFFDKDWMHEGRPAFAPAYRPDIVSAIKFMRARGIVPVLAHPGEKFDYRTCEDRLIVFRDAGLLGLEVYSTYHNAEQTKGFAILAEKLELFPTCGSDYHGEKIKPGIKLGMLDIDGKPILAALERAKRECIDTRTAYL